MVSTASERPGSWDIAALAVLNEAAYEHFLGVLDGLAPAPASDAQIDVPARADTVVSRIVRDSAIVRRLKLLYDNRCQVCGEQVSGLHGWTYAEAHHVRPLGAPHNGPDSEDNLLVVCPNHHAACDFGALELNLSAPYSASGHSVRSEYIRYHNEAIARRPG
jgi:predicted restriction endonuclease